LKVKRLFVAGGAVWCRGNVTEHVEFNFHRDPRAASRVLASGLPITVVPLDVSGLVCFDESHVAHLAASGYRTGQIPAELLEHALEYDGEPAYGKTFVPAAVAVGSVLWPELFMKTRMQLQIVAEGPQAGRSKPALGGDKSKQVDLLTAVNAAEFLERALESLCHEAFVV
ncbi:MAG TPA: nucleoside hydrolase, partial [Phycisphaerae bacterium]|nr:nucleoside hydrolase [Phycisphaerae bacterium]